MSIAATENSARFGSTSQPGPVDADGSERVVDQAIDRVISTWKVRPTPTALTSTGKKTTERR